MAPSHVPSHVWAILSGGLAACAAVFGKLATAAGVDWEDSNALVRFAVSVVACGFSSLAGTSHHHWRHRSNSLMIPVDQADTHV